MSLKGKRRKEGRRMVIAETSLLSGKKLSKRREGIA